MSHTDESGWLFYGMCFECGYNAPWRVYLGSYPWGIFVLTTGVNETVLKNVQSRVYSQHISLEWQSWFEFRLTFVAPLINALCALSQGGGILIGTSIEKQMSMLKSVTRDHRQWLTSSRKRHYIYSTCLFLQEMLFLLSNEKSGKVTWTISAATTLQCFFDSLVTREIESNIKTSGKSSRVRGSISSVIRLDRACVVLVAFIFTINEGVICKLALPVTTRCWIALLHNR